MCIDFTFETSDRQQPSDIATQDKQIKVGIVRTDIDSILAEFYEESVEKPSAEQLVEPKNIVRKRFKVAQEKYGDRMTFTGPDCGLGG